MITELIDTPDFAEIIRDTVYSILDTEQANQVALATAAGKPDPQLWALEVHRESTQVLDYVDDPTVVPFVNVRLDRCVRETDASTTSGIYKFETWINIDVIGASAASTTQPASTLAALKVNRGVRLVRQILGASQYARLGLRTGATDSRRFEEITFGRPDIDTVNAVAAATLRLSIKCIETGPQTQAGILNLIDVTTNRDSDGLTLFAATFGG